MEEKTKGKGESRFDKQFIKTVRDEDIIDKYQDVANAIVARAAEDYREVVRQLHQPGLPDIQRESLLEEKKELLKFLSNNNEWYQTLTNVNPEYIVERIDMEFE